MPVTTDNTLKLSALMGAIVIFTIVALLALWVSHSTVTKELSKQALRSTQQINEKLTLVSGTLHSMAAVHQASATGFEPTQFEMFADKLVSNQASITATGRYDVVLYEDLEHLQSDTQLHGVVKFQPTTITDEGIITPLDSKSQYTILIAFFPQDPVSANLIGLDFSELTSTQSAILESISRNAPIPAELPARWLATGQLNLFVPTYYGYQIPDSAEDRSLQTDGGYFITLDLNEIIAQVTGDEFPLSIGISVRSINNDTLLVNQGAGLNEQQIATRFFPSLPIKHHLRIGSESATVVYRTPAGVTQTQLLSAMIKGLIALALFLIGLAIFTAVKISRAETVANKLALAKEREQALVTLNSLQDGVITTDQADIIEFVNPSMLDVLNTNRAALVGLPLEEVLSANFTAENSVASYNDADSSNISSINSIRQLLDNSQETKFFDCHSSAIVDQDNNKIGAILTMRDISKEHALTTKLAHQATHDALTALPNRRKFESLLEKIMLQKEAVASGCFVVGYIDLDQFKLVNDTVGHAAGDALLKKLAIDLESLAPENITIARLGGDEFGFISTKHNGNQCANDDNTTNQKSDGYRPNNQSKNKNTKVATGIARLFHEFFQSYFYQTQDNTFSIRASIGLTTIKPDHSTINDVLTEVDIACYTAKDSGRNGYVIYDAEDVETKQREGEMLYLPMLQTALKNDRFVLYTQPIASTNAGTKNPFHHYECLLRLIDDDGEIVTPYKFIVAAERYDLINDIDRWVIESAFSQIDKLRGTALENTIFSINLSGQSAVDSSMPDFIEEKLTEHNINSSNICFELTETAVISNFAQAQKLIAFARNRGCTIALDDFGAGASSYGYLKNLEVDYLKIDGQFVKEMTSNKVDFEMVRSMNAVGKALGIKTIAEFVESEDIMQELASINVDFAQGYHIGKPAPMADLLDSDRLQYVA